MLAGRTNQPQTLTTHHHSLTHSTHSLHGYPLSIHPFIHHPSIHPSIHLPCPATHCSFLPSFLTHSQTTHKQTNEPTCPSFFLIRRLSSSVCLSVARPSSKQAKATREGRKERKEGRKERKEGRKEGRKEACLPACVIVRCRVSIDHPACSQTTNSACGKLVYTVTNWSVDLACWCRRCVATLPDSLTH